ncbi:MAG TPA: hypothetical protein GX706_00570 [Candidatus Moranbacteria bacterium]|nr:hypothetical protein [Candidatus Moranbacteria bacterium]
MKTKILALNSVFVSTEVGKLVETGLLLLVAVIAPALLAHTPANQWITGSIVNATLFLAAWRLGFINAALIAIFPSSIALINGLLPAPMATMIPFIILANVALILSASLVKNKLASMIFASLIKFSILFIISSLIFSSSTTPLLQMFSWPQLVTALAGGLIALAFFKTLNKKSI